MDFRQADEAPRPSSEEPPGETRVVFGSEPIDEISGKVLDKILKDLDKPVERITLEVGREPEVVLSGDSEE